MTRTDLVAFDQAWGRFSSQLSAYSPADFVALQPAASVEELTRLEAQLGFRLHPEVRALLERHNGVAELQPTGDRDPFQPGAFLLGYRLNHTDRIASEHVNLVDFGEENIASDLWEEGELNGHPHQWVPIAHSNDAGVVFVDHRPGPTYGRVYEMGIGSGDIDATEWASGVAELLERFADCFEAGTPFTDYRPRKYAHSSGRHSVDWEIHP
ncbi:MULTISPECIES: SMI1/KNR4 family protein [unclassified Streptomyces]|uniref:SMI1/KNR4 family protein n=1 Tax=unclassified Streptomyces TaxID=2593676 RepID=UPI002E2D4FB6|nr:SMI1/KNR4 family protein [Streptomyces sp. NBC_00223]